MDVRLTLGEVGRWGRAVLDHGGDPVGRSAAGGWLANCQKLVRELAPGRERVDELGALRRNRGSRSDSPCRRRRRR